MEEEEKCILCNAENNTEEEWFTKGKGRGGMKLREGCTVGKGR